MDHLAVINKIKKDLTDQNETQFVNQINNGLLMGGTGGEILSIICSLLKVYKKKYPVIFKQIKAEANSLFRYAQKLGYDIIPNYDLLTELDK